MSNNGIILVWFYSRGIGYDYLIGIIEVIGTTIKIFRKEPEETGECPPKADVRGSKH